VPAFPEKTTCFFYHMHLQRHLGAGAIVRVGNHVGCGAGSRAERASG